MGFNKTFLNNECSFSITIKTPVPLYFFVMPGYVCRVTCANHVCWSRVPGHMCRVMCAGSRVPGHVCRVSCAGSRVPGHVGRSGASSPVGPLVLCGHPLNFVDMRITGGFPRLGRENTNFISCHLDISYTEWGFNLEAFLGINCTIYSR